MVLTLNEMASDPEDCSYNQPCKFGHCVKGHAVYCHNEYWPNKPMKCRRSWYTGGEVKDEDCERFVKNDRGTP